MKRGWRQGSLCSSGASFFFCPCRSFIWLRWSFQGSRAGKRWRKLKAKVERLEKGQRAILEELDSFRRSIKEKEAELAKD